MVFATKMLFRRQFRLPEFSLEPLAFEMIGPEEGELLLDRVVTRVGEEARIVTLAAPMPTAGELSASIERHLRSTDRPSVPAAMDAVDELRDALADLRRSLA